MSAPDQDSAEKSHEPTPQKLKKAREKGEVARSTDLSVAAGYAGLLLVLLAIGGTSANTLGEGFMVLLDQAENLSDQVFSGAIGGTFGHVIWGVLAAVAPWFVVPAAAVLVSILAQRSFIVTPSKLRPKFSRISFVSNAKNKYGRAGLFEFFKNSSKLLIYSVFLGVFFRARLVDMLNVMATGPGPEIMLLARLCIEFLLVAVLISAAIGVLDTIWQHNEHLRKNRMSRKEISDETKDTEGDPHVKGQRRQLGQQIAMNQMMTKVPESDVVIVNPTHYAVCLKWSGARGTAPVCVAKGVDEMAATIRHAAERAGVPVHHDPPTARALHATTELGQEIAEEHFRAVAASIRFAEQMRIRTRGKIQ